MSDLKAPFTAYKVFDPDWKCRGFQFEVGKEYRHDGDIGICRTGFHACLKLTDCFDYYAFDPNNRVAEVDIRGEFATHSEDSKVVTSLIYISREISWAEVLGLINTGAGNTGRDNSGRDNSGHSNSGDSNSGDSNSGDSNSGDWNSGDWNSGDRNSGDWNSGHSNSGDSNSGDSNSGDSNSGDWNSGDWNSGDWNACDNSSGVFCTKAPKVLIFDQPTDMTLGEWRNTEASRILQRFNPLVWIWSKDMLDHEKKSHPEHETTGGFLRAAEFKDFWRSLPKPDQEKIKTIPNFDAAKFEKITGVDVNSD